MLDLVGNWAVQHCLGRQGEGGEGGEEETYASCWRSESTLCSALSMAADHRKRHCLRTLDGLVGDGVDNEPPSIQEARKEGGSEKVRRKGGPPDAPSRSWMRRQGNGRRAALLLR
ncbi:hypothetical protein CDL15_Pgr006429 [Punica granatum]|nr:hypothetical protein CDL15_Pgr006429 [Punica granatum]